MSTRLWTVAPAGYLENRDPGARLFDALGCGLPAVGSGVPMRTAAPSGIHTPGIHITGIHTTFDGTTLGIPSSRRPSS
jgi:hypothetical protein